MHKAESADALRAGRVVIATNGAAANLPELARALVIISSDIVATAPIPERLAQIGWSGGEAITDSQQMVDYYRTTRDGRIAFGKGAGRVAYGGNIGEEFDRNAPRVPEVLADFHRYYPMLRDVPITHDWSGPVDRSADGMPLIGHLGARQRSAGVMSPPARRKPATRPITGTSFSVRPISTGRRPSTTTGCARRSTS